MTCGNGDSRLTLMSAVEVFVRPRIPRLGMLDKLIVQAQHEGVAAVRVVAARESVRDLADVVEQPFVVDLVIRILILMLIAHDVLFEG